MSLRTSGIIWHSRDHLNRTIKRGFIMVLPTSETDGKVLVWTGQIVVTKYGQAVPVASYIPQPIEVDSRSFQGEGEERPLSGRVCTVVSGLGAYMSQFFERIMTSISETYTDDQLEALNNRRILYPYGSD